ncbi:MAG: phosphotransferase [Chloroflexi bacterium]|nr:phosphotransferase [Chloroflexota bacterium]
MLPQLQKRLIDGWHELKLPEPRPTALHFLGQLFSFHKTCFFVFVDQERAPRYLAKIPRSPRYSTGIRREYENVRSLRDQVDQDLGRTIPNPIALLEIDGHAVTIEPFFSGRPLNSILGKLDLRSPATMERAFDLATDWLIRLHRATGRWGDGALARPLEEFRETFPLTDREEAFIARMIDQARAAAPELPTVFTHGHYGAENILVEGARRLVIDWDWGKPSGPPAIDLFHFITMYCFRANGLEQMVGDLDDYGGAFEALYLTSGLSAELARRALARYSEALGIAPRHWKLLAALYLAEEANERHRHLVERAERGGYWYPLRDLDGHAAPYHQLLRHQTEAGLLRLLAREERRFVLEDR